MFINVFVCVSFISINYKATYRGDKITDAKDKILMSIGETWKSTNKIADESNVNWYRAEYILNQLYEEGMVERDKKDSRVQYWRSKQKDENNSNEEEEEKE